MTPKTVLVTGTNRGIGLEIAKQFLQRGYTVIGAVRAPEKQPQLDPVGDAKFHVVALDIGEPESIKGAINKIKDDLGFATIDIVVNNAAIGPTRETVALVRDAKSSDYIEQFKINTMGTLELFVNVYPLLPKDGTGKFVGISTAAAMQSMEHWPKGAAYGTSKNAVNYIVRQIHSEEKHLIAFTMSPGWVDTDMGKAGADAFGVVEGPPEKASETIPQLVTVIEKATREKESGYMVNYDGSICDW